LRILLIEDTVAYEDEFRQLLAEAGYADTPVHRASTASEGLTLLAAGAYHICFVEYGLPGDNGLSVVRRARQAAVTTPIVMLTAVDAPDIDLAAEEAGASDFLAKGRFTPQMLGRCIRYTIRNAAHISAAQTAEERFRLAQDAARIGTWDWNIGTGDIAWSDRQYDIWGIDRTAGPILYETWSSTIHPDDRDSAQAAVLAAIGGGAKFDTIYRILRRDPAHPAAPPQTRWLSANGIVLRDPAGAPSRMVGINIDITDQQRAVTDLHLSRNNAVAKMQASEARFRAYFESSSDCLFHTRQREDGAIVYVTLNKAALVRAGATLAQAVGRAPEDILGAEIGSRISANIRQVYETGRPLACEPTFTMQSEAVTFDSLYLPLRDEHGHISGVLASSRDITERRRLELSLQQAQKMESLGQLAGGVAHDFNNLLTAMGGCLELLGKRHVTSEGGTRLVAEALRTVERGASLTARLLAFSRQQPLVTGIVDINASLVDMSEMMQRTLGSGLHIVTRLAEDAWLTRVDRNQVEIAVLNLAINARDAMPEGGSLTLQTQNRSIEAQDEIGLAPGDYLALSVSDTGAGMPPDILARALEPFFTTKEQGKGTGLGLSMVYGVVRQLGGDLRIASQPANGTTVTLYLPRALATPQSDSIDPPQNILAFKSRP